MGRKTLRRKRMNMRRIASARSLTICLTFAGLSAIGLADGSNGSANGFVVPTQLYANEAFTFDATGAKSGQFVDVSTVSGEVVQHARTDKLGRVFLDGGLAAGTYLLTSGSGKSHGVEQITVKPCPTEDRKSVV